MGELDSSDFYPVAMEIIFETNNLWYNTSEEFIRSNSEYPGDWAGEAPKRRQDMKSEKKIK